MDLGQEQADAESLGGDLIAVGPGNPLDDPVQAKSAKIIADSNGFCGPLTY